LQDLLEHLDIDAAVQQLLQSSPEVLQDTAKLAVTLCLGDVAAAQQLLSTSTDAPAASPGSQQLEKYLVSVKQTWVLPQATPSASVATQQQQESGPHEPVDTGMALATKPRPCIRRARKRHC
jgi:hypothetical protein